MSKHPNLHVTWLNVSWLTGYLDNAKNVLFSQCNATISKPVKCHQLSNAGLHKFLSVWKGLKGSCLMSKQCHLWKMCCLFTTYITSSRSITKYVRNKTFALLSVILQVSYLFSLSLWVQVSSQSFNLQNPFLDHADHYDVATSNKWLFRTWIVANLNWVIK